MPERGHICAPRSQIWDTFWQIKYAESMDNRFLKLYQVLGSLGAKSGLWGAEMQMEFSPMLAKSAKRGLISQPQSQIGGISGKHSTQNPWRICS